MDRTAGYTNHWTFLTSTENPDGGFTDAQWSTIVQTAHKIINAATAKGIVVAGPMGEGRPIINNEYISLNGDASTDNDFETFFLPKTPNEEDRRFHQEFLDAVGTPIRGRPGEIARGFCKTGNRPYDAVVASILAVAVKVSRGSFKAKTDSGAIRKVLAAKDSCWDGYEAIGMKEKDGRKVPNCVPENKTAAFKDPSEMSPAAINRELDKLSDQLTEISRKFIDAGRGHETNIEISRQTDPLSNEYNAVQRRYRELSGEITRQYGPGAPSRFPAGWKRKRVAKQFQIGDRIVFTSYVDDVSPGTTGVVTGRVYGDTYRVDTSYGIVNARAEHMDIAKQRWATNNTKEAGMGDLLGTMRMWRGRRVLVLDVHGYPPKTADIRWTVSGVPGSRNEVSQSKRNVPIEELEPIAESASDTGRTAAKYPAIVKEINADYQRQAITRGERQDLIEEVSKAPTESAARRIVDQHRKSRTAARYRNDPYWITAKYPGVDAKGRAFKKGEKIFYYPLTKTILSGGEAEDAAYDFNAAAMDEDYMSRAASDRKRLIRLASSLPVGDETRKAILAGLVK